MVPATALQRSVVPPWSPPHTFSSLPAHTSFMTHLTFLWVTAWYKGVKDVL